MNSQDETLEVVDIEGRVLRLATRRECHSDPSLIHRVVHVLVFNSAGQLFLQKRGLEKDIQPGKWDTSVGGHLCPGETEQAGAAREMAEELGIYTADMKELYQYVMWSEVETELVTTFLAVWDNDITIDPKEIVEGRFWDPEEIEENWEKECFTPNFKDEYTRWKKIRPPRQVEADETIKQTESA